MSKSPRYGYSGGPQFEDGVRKSGMNFYHQAASVALNVEKGEGLRSQLYGGKASIKKDLPKILFLTANALQKKNELDELISKCGLSSEIPEKELWLARILVTELVLGRKSFHPKCPIMRAVYKKKIQLKKAAVEMKLSKKPETNVSRYVRVNVNIVTMAQAHTYLKDIAGYTLEPNRTHSKELGINSYCIDQHVPCLLIFHSKAPIHNLDWVDRGKLILQDKSSCLIAHLLAPHPCSTILDMCAAPGLKTQHVASLNHGLGRIVAVEKNEERFNSLCQLKERFSLDNVICVHSDVLNTENMNEYRHSVEYILLDPPCSGSGIVKNYDYGQHEDLNSRRHNKLHNLQIKMLKSALSDYPAARRITYSTCSISEEENEAVVEEILNEIPGTFQLVDLSSFYPGLSRGRTNYKCGSKCIRLSPEVDDTNGFFIAMFERLCPIASPQIMGTPAVEEKSSSVVCKKIKTKKKSIQ